MTTHDYADVEDEPFDDGVPASAPDAPTETSRVAFDAETRTVTEAVVSAVANARGCDPLDVPPLYHTIDPDALDSFFTPTNGQRQIIDATLEFEYDDHTVTVKGYGMVEARDTSLHPSSL